MERFVFVAAIIIAIIYGIVAMVGAHVGVEFDGPGASPIVQLAPGTMAAQTYAGTSIEIKHAAATVTIVPEDRQDFSVQIDNPGHAPMPSVSLEDGHVVVDGNLRGRIGHCSENEIQLRGYSNVSRTDLPRITIHAPRALSAEMGGAVFAQIGATQSFEGGFSGCGDSTVADVAQEMKLSLSGSGSVHAGAAHSLEANLSGSGEIATAAITGPAQVNISGSGSTTIGSLNGSLEDNSSGSGDLNVRGGSITNADINLVGSGGATIDAPVQTLKVSGLGSGDVEVNGAVGSVEADLVGSGDVRVASVSGTVTRHSVGSGTVHVGH